MIYLTRIPSDAENQHLGWFTAVATKREAMNLAQNQVAWLNEELLAIGEIAEPWRIQYISVKSGDDYYRWQGKNVVVVQQMESYYHGA
jgi:hypothetical protein